MNCPTLNVDRKIGRLVLKTSYSYAIGSIVSIAKILTASSQILQQNWDESRRWHQNLP
jgi:hypothetical protein